MRRVLLVASSYAPNVGGLQTVTAQLARGLRARGIAVEVLTNQYPRALAPREIISDVPVRRLNFLLPRWSDLRRGRVDLFLAGLCYAPLTFAQLWWAIRQFKPDAVNLHFVGAPAPFVLLAHWLEKFRLVVSLHGDDVQGLARRGKFDRWVFQKLVTRADAVTACSQFLLSAANAYANIPAERAHVIYNALDVKPLPHAAGSEIEWVAAGRLAPKKGFDVLLRTLGLLKDAAPHLTLIGDGPERGTLMALTRELDLEARVEFRGALPHDETLALIASARAVVVPSREEPFGMVALEAMAAGKPIVATCAGGLPEVLAGADAILVAPGDVDALARGIAQMQMRLASDPSYGAPNRDCAARFNTARMIDAYLGLML